jgi:hypothetical protein
MVCSLPLRGHLVFADFFRSPKRCRLNIVVAAHSGLPAPHSIIIL